MATANAAGGSARPGLPRALDTRAAADALELDFEQFVRHELRLNVEHTPLAQRASAAGDGKTGVCNYFLKGHCRKGNHCIYRHMSREQSERALADNRTVVCKYWLRGLCKKDDDCEFLHEYNLEKMPKCTFFIANGVCVNRDDCLYQHIDPEERIKECPWYARGFCKHGAKCRSKHVRRLLCPYYQFGFCPNGPNCRQAHPRFELPKMHPDAPAQLPQASGFAPMLPM
ncbi:Cleavage and polyadenylation specificity factor subunit 4 [Coemansia javaensis]|uniref:mRNA 3'-end-processing protein n=1 Tax=Coemansia javaensis TaxID=2761396 RepID=A0A9W8H2S6_9FUNG|nr:Cleavage and polyadenylation specificity factor subunit 4 [Coemansia javaensis]